MEAKHGEAKVEVMVVKPAPTWEKPQIKIVPLTELQSHWPRLLSIESSLYASGCHHGRIH